MFYHITAVASHRPTVNSPHNVRALKPPLPKGRGTTEGGGGIFNILRNYLASQCTLITRVVGTRIAVTPVTADCLSALPTYSLPVILE